MTGPSDICLFFICLHKIFIFLIAKSFQNIAGTSELHHCFWVLAFSEFCFFWPSECAQLRGDDTSRLCVTVPEQIQGQSY